jgi:hypothetical protein
MHTHAHGLSLQTPFFMEKEMMAKTAQLEEFDEALYCLQILRSNHWHSRYHTRRLRAVLGFWQTHGRFSCRLHIPLVLHDALVLATDRTGAHVLCHTVCSGVVVFDLACSCFDLACSCLLVLTRSDERRGSVARSRSSCRFGALGLGAAQSFDVQARQGKASWWNGRRNSNL